MSSWTASHIARYLSDFIDPVLRSKRALELLGGLTADADGLVERTRHVRSAYEASRRAVTRRTAAYLLLAVTLLHVDPPLQALVVGASFPSFPTALQWGIGLGIFVVAAALAHGLVYGFVDDEARPQRAPRLAAAVGGVLLLMFILATTMGILTLRVWDPILAGQFRGLAQLSIIAAAEFGAGAGALLGVAAWPGVRTWWLRRRLLGVRVELGQLIKVGDLLTKEAGAESIQAWATKRAELLRVIAEIKEAIAGPKLKSSGMTSTATLLLLAVALNSACRMSPSSEPPDLNTAAVKPEEPSTSDSRRTCGFLVDDSRSLDTEQRTRAVRLLVLQVEHLVQRFDCGTVAVGTFADGGEWTGSIEYLSLPRFAAGTDCSKIQPTIEGLDNFLASNPAYRDNLEQDARRQCEVRQAQARGAVAAELEPVVAQVSEMLATEAAGAATDVAGVVQAVLRPGGIVFVVTDGVQTVKRSQSLVVPPNALVVILIVPTGVEYGGAKATRAAAEVWRHVDGVLVHPYPMVADPGFLDEVGRKLARN